MLIIDITIRWIVRGAIQRIVVLLVGSWPCLRGHTYNGVQLLDDLAVHLFLTHKARKDVIVALQQQIG